MKLAGIYIEKYCSHFSRSAVSSYTKSKGVTLKDIAVLKEHLLYIDMTEKLKISHTGQHMLQSVLSSNLVTYIK